MSNTKKSKKPRNPIFRFFGKPYRYAAVFSLLLAAAFTFALLETFVLPREYRGSTVCVNPPVLPPRPASAPVITDTSYKDENIDITIETVRVLDTNVHIVEVKLSSAALLKNAFAKDAYGRNINQKTSVIAAEKDAIFAVNGDFYGFRDTGWVLRNGELYRSGADRTALLMDVNGDLSLSKNDDEIRGKLPHTWQIWSFTPVLVKEGEITAPRNSESSFYGEQPRTAIGQVGKLHYIFITTDGRDGSNAGLPVYDLAVLFKERGCTIAYNLDGGGSATMYFNGKLVNHPAERSNKQGEREVSDIVYIGY